MRSVLAFQPTFFFCVLILYLGVSCDVSNVNDDMEPVAEQRAQKEKSLERSFQDFGPLFFQEQQVQYQLYWSWDRAVWDPLGKAYVFKNQEGYTVGLTSLYVGVATVQMVPCASVQRGAWRWPFLLGSRVSYADHRFEIDISLLQARVVEDALSKTPTSLGQARTSIQPYCQVHILYAPLSKMFDNGFAVKNKSAVISGWFQAPSSAIKTHFQVSTPLANGSLLDIEEVKILDPPSIDSKIVLRIVRDPVEALNDAKFSVLSPQELAYQFVQRLSRASRASLKTPY